MHFHFMRTDAADRIAAALCAGSAIKGILLHEVGFALVVRPTVVNDVTVLVLCMCMRRRGGTKHPGRKDEVT